MSKKKKFGQGINAILGGLNEDTVRNVSERDSESIQPEESSSRPLPAKTGRGSRLNIWIEKDLDRRIRALGYLERKPIREVIEQALEEYIKSIPEEYVEQALNTYAEKN